jgi:uncharacterized protein YukE
MAENTEIDVDIDELERFINVLQDFQDFTREKFRRVQNDWDRCEQSWQGDSKEHFTRDFEKTLDQVKRNLEVGDDALEWLEKYFNIIDEFENGY